MINDQIKLIKLKSINQIKLKSKSEDFKVEFSPLYKFSKIALKGFYIEVACDNISEKYTTNKFKYYYGKNGLNEEFLMPFIILKIQIYI